MSRPCASMSGWHSRRKKLGFAALWTRDVWLRDPNFGDLGQVYDPWVWLGRIAAQTYGIALATGSIILPLRHPVHTAKPRRPSTSFPAAASCSASRPVTAPPNSRPSAWIGTGAMSSSARTSRSCGRCSPTAHQPCCCCARIAARRPPAIVAAMTGSSSKFCDLSIDNS